MAHKIISLPLDICMSGWYSALMETELSAADRKKAWRKAWREANPEKVKAQKEKWRKANPDKVKAQRARTYQKNLDKEHAAVQSWRDKNKEKMLKKQADWKKNNPEKVKLHFLKARTLREVNQEVSFAHLTWLHKWQNHQCFYCCKSLNHEQHLDHIIPVIKNGENTNDNVAYACKSCNLSKGKKYYGIAWHPKTKLKAPLQKAHQEFLKDLAKTVNGVFTTDYVEIEGVKITILSSFYFSFLGKISSIEYRKEFPDTIVFWDFEWKNNKETIIKIISAKTKKYAPIGARKLTSCELIWPEYSAFMDARHLKKSKPATFYFGLRDKEGNILAAAGISMIKGVAELSRLAFDGAVSGGLSKLLAYFRKVFNYQGPIISYCDSRLGPGQAYTACGFTLMSQGNLDYNYVNSTGIVNRLKFAPSVSGKPTEIAVNEETWANHLGFRRLWGFPQHKYVHLPEQI